MNIQANHSKHCSGTLYPSKDSPVGLGLVRAIQFKCSKCDVCFEKFTEDLQKPRSAINTGAVWGCLATGGTYSHLEEQLACLQIPPISKRVFYETENELGKVLICYVIFG